MTETQVRYNEGKLKLSYWMGTKVQGQCPDLEFVSEWCGAIDGRLSGVADNQELAADNLEQALGQFVRGELDHDQLLDITHAVFGGEYELAEGFCRACMFGEEKYWRGGFMVGAPISQYVDSASRHLKALRMSSAEYVESFTKDGVTHTRTLNHWWGVAWNLVMIYEVLESAPERDDRLFHKGDYSGKPLELSAPEPTVPASLLAAAEADVTAFDARGTSGANYYYDRARASGEPCCDEGCLPCGQELTCCVHER